MTKWLDAKYRDFDDVPCAMLCTSARGRFFPFALASREFLPYDSIATMLGE
jgi:hypothetical protein